MDYGALPPEVNSARMYAGAGGGPMTVAAAAWDQLAADLHFSALSYQSAITGLTSGAWQGPASASMAAAAAPYATWMITTAAQCEQVANQARAAVSAYESAFAMTVPPPLIAANRAQLLVLVATNFLGQNTPAIMATEAHYGEMWAQDAAAMYGYAASSAAASTLPPFMTPQQNTRQSGLAAQAAALAQATGSAAASHAHITASSLSAIPRALSSLAHPTSSTFRSSHVATAGASGKGVGHSGGNSSSAFPGLGGFSGLMGTGKGASNTVADLSSNAAGLGSDLGGLGTNFVGIGSDSPGTAGLTGSGTGSLGNIAVARPWSGGFAGLGPSGGPVGAGALASMGQAASLGTLSVPQSWAAVSSVGSVGPASAVAGSPGNLGAAPAVTTVGSPMPMVSMPGMASRAAEAAVHKLGIRSYNIPLSPMAG